MNIMLSKQNHRNRKDDPKKRFSMMKHRVMSHDETSHFIHPLSTLPLISPPPPPRPPPTPLPLQSLTLCHRKAAVFINILRKCQRKDNTTREENLDWQSEQTSVNTSLWIITAATFPLPLTHNTLSHAHTHMHTHTLTHKHAHTHTHTHTHTLS